MSSVSELPLSDYEFERGKPPPSFNHGVIQCRLGVQFSKSDQFQVLSELTLAMEEKPDLVPDLSLMNPRQYDPYDDEIRVIEPPLVTVEILTPPQSSYEVMAKAERYFKHGVKGFWLVDPTMQCVTVRTAEGDVKLYSKNDLVTDAVTGLKVDLKEVFRRSL